MYHFQAMPSFDLAYIPQHRSSSHASTRPQNLGSATVMSLLKTQPAWLILAIASGGCAAFNGVFAKLYYCRAISY